MIMAKRQMRKVSKDPRIYTRVSAGTVVAGDWGGGFRIEQAPATSAAIKLYTTAPAS